MLEAFKNFSQFIIAFGLSFISAIKAVGEFVQNEDNQALLAGIGTVFLVILILIAIAIIIYLFISDQSKKWEFTSAILAGLIGGTLSVVF